MSKVFKFIVKKVLNKLDEKYPVQQPSPLPPKEVKTKTIEFQNRDFKMVTSSSGNPIIKEIEVTINSFNGKKAPYLCYKVSNGLETQWWAYCPVEDTRYKG